MLFNYSFFDQQKYPGQSTTVCFAVNFALHIKRTPCRFDLFLCGIPFNLFIRDLGARGPTT